MTQIEKTDPIAIATSYNNIWITQIMDTKIQRNTKQKFIK